jgi:hypothetical protein
MITVVLNNGFDLTDSTELLDLLYNIHSKSTMVRRLTTTSRWIVILLSTTVTTSYQGSSWKPRGFRSHVLSATTSDNSDGPLLTAPSTKKKTNNKGGRKTKKVKSEPDFWFDHQDPIFVNQSHVQCTIRGNPQPLKRHRSARGFMYNPSAASQRCFQEGVRNTLNITMPHFNDDEKGELVPITHFGSDQLIRLDIIFYMARPKNHFRSSIPGAGRLKAVAPWQVQRRVDVDNLAKFVLDSLNGVLYGDDQQVVSLSCTKCYDNEDDESRGKTLLSMQLVTQQDVTQLVTIPMFNS